MQQQQPSGAFLFFKCVGNFFDLLHTHTHAAIFKNKIRRITKRKRQKNIPVFLFSFDKLQNEVENVQWLYTTTTR
jgi:hypothetical protein